MSKVVIAVHGGASNATAYLKKHNKESQEGLIEALQKGHAVLKRGGTALKAVEVAVKVLENNPMFNAGRGSAVNRNGEVEMDASIMDGKTLKAGAVSMVTHVKNPIVLARTIMTKTKHVFLSGYGALELARYSNIELKDKNYFITPHEKEEFLKYKQRQKKINQLLQRASDGTVGAVAKDARGNIAAATSTGGTHYSLPGRIGDTCVIGAGCYADNKVCAVSGTGTGEFLIRGVIGHTIAMLIELKNYSLQEACDYVIHKRDKRMQGHMGVIAVNRQGDIASSFNTEILRRGWIDDSGKLTVIGYRDE